MLSGDTIKRSGGSHPLCDAAQIKGKMVDRSRPAHEARFKLSLPSLFAAARLRARSRPPDAAVSELVELVEFRQGETRTSLKACIQLPVSLLDGALSLTLQVLLQYTRYVTVLKWMTLSLFAYVAALFAVRTPWGEAIEGLLVPHLQLSWNFMTTLVAILGTTISPYLFFWQAAQEAEDTRVKPERTPLRWARRQAVPALARIRADTLTGMAFSNLIAVAIMTTTAATLHTNGVTEVDTSAQAAEALKPIAGEFASLIFTLGIVGTGLLAVPVLAGSAAYAVGESRRWPIGLSRAPKEAWAFYCTLGVATALGALLNFTSINPIKALYWSAVINGVVAVPVMVILMMITSSARIMGQLTVVGWLRWLGWAATAVMAACVAGMVVSWFA